MEEYKDWYDDDWTIEDEDDIENYEEDNPITPEQEAFAEEIKAVLQTLIDDEEVMMNEDEENINLDEDFISSNSLNKHFYKHCLANISNRKSKPTNVYYDFNSVNQYENYEKNLDSLFDISNKDLVVLQGPFDIEEVNKRFREVFKGDYYLTLGWSWGFISGKNAVQLNIHSFSSKVTTNYTGGNTVDILIRTSKPKTITLYSVDASRLRNKLLHVFQKYSSLSLTPSKDDKKLLDSLEYSKTKYLTENVSSDDKYLSMDYDKAMDSNWKHYIFSVETKDGSLHDERGGYSDDNSFNNAVDEIKRRYGNDLYSINAIHDKGTLKYYTDLYNRYLKNKNNNQQSLKNNNNSTNSNTPQNSKSTQNNQQPNNFQQATKRKNNPVYKQRTKNNSKIVQAFKNNGLPTDKLTQQVVDKNGRKYTRATPTLKKLRKDLFGESLKEDIAQEKPDYLNKLDLKSNGIYSLNTGWVKHPVQQDIPDIDMEEFEKEFKVWEDRYFELLDKISLEQIDDLIEDIYDLRKQGMNRNGEADIFNLIFKEFRNLGYLDTLKDLRKKEISKELSLEQLNEDIRSIQILSDKDIEILCEIIDEKISDYGYVISALELLEFARDRAKGIYENIYSVISKWTETDFVTFCIWKRNKLEIFDFFKLYKNKNTYETDVYFFVSFGSILDLLTIADCCDIGELHNVVVTTFMGKKSLDDYVKNLYRYDYKTRKFSNESLYDELNIKMNQLLNGGR